MKVKFNEQHVVPGWKCIAAAAVEFNLNSSMQARAAMATASDCPGARKAFGWRRSESSCKSRRPLLSVSIESIDDSHTSSSPPSEECAIYSLRVPN